MSAGALVVVVAQAEALVADLRQACDPSAARGMAAHVTVLVPFVHPEAADAAMQQRLHGALSALPAFDFTLARVGRFAQTAYLAPEPAAPFVQLTQAVVAAFPQWPPYGGCFDAVVPHLTVADGDAAAADAVEQTLRQRLAASGPVACRCAAVDWVGAGDADGIWRTQRVIALAAAAR